jgi:outer membrane receptor protein involved in Fe transport
MTLFIRPKFFRWAAAAAFCFSFATALLAAEARIAFDVPAGEGRDTLKKFAQQAGREIVYPPLGSVLTKAVKGEFTVREALDRMLAGTGLVAFEDAKTGGMVIQRREGPKAQGVAPSPVSRPAAPQTQEEVLRLNPFVVESDRTDTYTALNTNSITRFRTELKSIPISADVFTETFMQDIGATNVEQMLEMYSPAGFGGTNPTTSGQDLGRSGDYDPQSTTVLRGLATGQNLTRRNGFLPHWGPNDNFYMERVEVIRGPQALLYGAGGAGGVVNNVAKQARFGATVGTFDFRFDEHGTFRTTADFGRSYGPLALRVALLYDDAKYGRDFMGQVQNAGYVQLAYRLNSQHTLRLSADRLRSERILAQSSMTLRAAAVGPTPADPRNNQLLRLLLAQGRTADLVNGSIDWDNVDSFAGEFTQRKLRNEHVEAIWEGKWNQWLSTQISYGFDVADQLSATAPNTLTAPGRSGNPTGDWAIQFTNLQDSRWRQYNQGFRAVATAEFDFIGGRHQIVTGAENNLPDARGENWRYYEADANGKPIVNAAQALNANLGRTRLTTAQLGNSSWARVGSGPRLEPWSEMNWHPLQEQMTVGGRLYVRAPTGMEWIVPATADNPRGMAGTLGQFRDSKREAFFVAGMGAWLQRRLNVLYGLRYDSWTDNQNTYAVPIFVRSKGDSTSYNVGANYEFRPGLRAYYGYSVSYKTNLTNLAPDGSPNPPVSTGKGHELGLKFDLLDDRISGSLAYYTVRSAAENLLTGGDYLNLVNPDGINGRVTPNSIWIGVDRDSEGVELVLTARPAAGWRSRLSAAVTDGVVGETKSFRIVYNDEFNTDGRGGVTFGNGEPLLVKVNPQDTSVAAQRTPLTVAMMNDRSSPYFATLDPNSGEILNAAALGLTSANAAGATVGTGRVGLPVAQHQLNFTDPNGHRGTLPAVQAGLPTTSYAKYSASWTNNYTFERGLLKGWSLGGTLRYKGKDRSYYYNRVLLDAAGRAQSQLAVFGIPDATYVDLVMSYGFRVFARRCTLQLNVQNAFDEYKVVLLPNPASGEPQSARLTADGRLAFFTLRFNF